MQRRLGNALRAKKRQGALPELHIGMMAGAIKGEFEQNKWRVASPS